MRLVKPSVEFLGGYRAAPARHWSPNTMDPEAWRLELQRLDADPRAFLALQDDREAVGGPLTLPDGTHAPRLPSFKRWIWDGEFVGLVSVRAS